MIGSLGTNARAGSGPFVIEADEYDRTFLGLQPWAAVVTNVEHDHPDCYPTFEAMFGAFGEFVDLLPPDGVLVACCDNPPAKELGEQRALRKGQPVVMYGLGGSAAWRAVDVQANNAGGSDYVLLHNGQSAGLVRLRVPGLHNVVNSLAALAVADQLGVSFAQASRSLTEFRGMLRRFEIKGEAAGVTVVDDYGHHPTEIKASLGRRAHSISWPGHLGSVPAAHVQPHQDADGRLCESVRRRGSRHRHGYLRFARARHAGSFERRYCRADE